jgi:uracil-DNA glycosylase
MAQLRRVEVVLALGAIAWDACLRLTGDQAKFAHGAELVTNRWTVLGSYHVSQQNTQTGRLTAVMFDEVLRRAKQLYREK